MRVENAIVGADLGSAAAAAAVMGRAIAAWPRRQRACVCRRRVDGTAREVVRVRVCLLMRLVVIGLLRLPCAVRLVLEWLRRCVWGRYVTRLVLLLVMLRMAMVHKRWLTVRLRHTRVIAVVVHTAAAANAHAFAFDFAFALHARLFAERSQRTLRLNAWAEI